MAILQLPPCPAGAEEQASDGARKNRRDWLRRVENEVVRKVVAGGEARMWLCAALGSLDLPPNAQSSAFLRLVSTPGDEGRSVCERVVRMVCENKPSWAAKLIARDDRLIRRFFEGDSQRILNWFGKFCTGSESEHQWGARALARYTFIHRDTCWNELHWKGDHGQAPATVATKPHYFLELDVLRTIDNFLDNVPSFWRSEELRDSMRSGEFLSLEMEYFTRELVERMLADDCPETWSLVGDYLAEESMSKLANCVLHILSGENLLSFVNDLVAQLQKPSSLRFRGSGKKKNWLQDVIFSGEKCGSLSELILCNALANNRRQIMNIVRSEDHEDEARVLKGLLSEAEGDSRVVWSVRRESLRGSKWECIKLLGLEALCLYASLAGEKSGEFSYPEFFTENGIRFDEPPVLNHRKRRKKKTSRKSRKKQHRDESTSSGESSDDSGVENRGWRLCTDNFSFIWRKEDIPEHLSSFAFDEWVKWSISNW